MQNIDTSKKVAIAIGGSRKRYWMTGKEYTGILIGKDATNGEYVITEGTIDIGGFVPEHYHKWEDQTFHIVQGTVEAKIGNETVIAGRGDAIHCSRGVPHLLKNIGNEEVKIISYLFPGHLAEDFFEESNRQIRGGSFDPEKIDREFGVVYL